MSAPDAAITEALGRIDLTFRDQEEFGHVGDPLHHDLSALAVVGRTLFASCDETASVERLVFDPESGTFTHHTSFPLGDVFDLPGGRDGEMDIEGLEADGRWLWVCGSHGLKRDDPVSDDLDGLDDVDWDANRAFLGRLPLVDRGDGIYKPVGTFEPLEGETRHARALSMAGKDDRGPVREMLAEDPLIGPFLDLPCKENGLDIEGLATHGDTVWLGLRGPVVGAYALVVEMRLKEKGKKNRRLKPRKRKGDKHRRRHRLYAVDLGGQAIRDLLYLDGAMYFLSGATTDLEAMQAVYVLPEWPPRKPVVRGHQLRRVIDLPVIRGSDHAEGLALFRKPTGEGDDEGGGEPRLLVAYDSPDDDRMDDPTRTVAVDEFPLPELPGDDRADTRAR
jgi:hypothetical protein